MTRRFLMLGIAATPFYAMLPADPNEQRLLPAIAAGEKLVTRALQEGEIRPVGEERARRIALLEQQKRAYQDLMGRRGQVADRLESSVLAMQNMRFDLLRLRSAGVGAVINDLSQATMQARALSRDVDHAIAAASEVREALG